MSDAAPLASAIAAAQQMVRAGEHAAARAALDHVLAQDATHAQAWLLHALAAAGMGDPAAAAASMERVLALAPAQPAGVWLVYADILLDAGDAPRAEAAARQAVAGAPESAAALNLLGAALHRQGRATEAEQAYRAALAADPAYLNAYRNLADIARERGDLDTAIALRGDVLARGGTSAQDHLALARVLHQAVRLERAIALYREALRLDPSYAWGWSDLGNAYSDAGLIEEAHAAYREALRLRPDLDRVESTLLINLHYDAALDADTIFDAHRAWAKRHAASIVAAPPPRRAARSRLRVGFLSPAFRAGPTGAFALPLLENLDRSRFELFAYNANGRHDSLTPRMRAAVDAWHDAWTEDDEALASRIRADELDVLVDLAGHAPGGRPLVLARKPAPCVVTWLDYFDTTGLDAVDYLVADTISAPPGGRQEFSERLARLDPCRLCYAPPVDAPAPLPPPVLRNGFMTFGSFNRLSKIGPRVVEAWSAILNAVPRSRVLLKNPALHDGSTRERMLAQFAGHGIARERIELRGFSPHRRMLEEYGDMDVALDPFPYNGGLTTCEALWMGVPVLCLLGDTLISRQSAALLAAAGYEEDVAENADALVARAVRLASDPDALARARAERRDRVARSPLVDGAAFARRFGALLEEIAGG